MATKPSGQAALLGSLSLWFKRPVLQKLIAPIHMPVLPAGKVWAQCDEVKKGPLDNKTALFRRLAAAMVAIKVRRV